MLRHIVLLSLLAITAGTVYAAPALDTAGKCRDHGKFVAASMCAVAAPAGKCRDMKTKKFAKCSAVGTEPVPGAK
jgi:hypothetical protein